MSGTCSMHGGNKCVQNITKLNGRDNLGDLEVEGRIKLQNVFEKRRPPFQKSLCFSFCGF
jgi:hypothetical protein